MQQKRLLQELAWVETLERLQNRIIDAGIGNTDLIVAKGRLRRYKIVKYALNKAIIKDAAQIGSRAHCPDCGTNIRFSDNYCRKCGQRLRVKRAGEK